MKIRPVGAELFHADTDMKLITAFRNFANAPDKSKLKRFLDIEFAGFDFH
jgi:hypothetical protein